LTFVCYSELPDTATVNTRHTATEDGNTTHEGQIKYTCTSLFYSNSLTCFVITSQLVYACRRPYCFTNDFVPILLSVQCRYCLKTNGQSSHLFDILLGPSFCFVFLAPCTAGTKFQGDKGGATGYADYASAYTPMKLGMLSNKHNYFEVDLENITHILNT